VTVNFEWKFSLWAAIKFRIAGSTVKDVLEKHLKETLEKEMD
jgi:hypothetical protein